MIALIAAAVGALTEALKLANTKESRRYIDRMAKLRLEIAEEEARGYESDDAKIESLYKELRIVFDAVQQEIALYQSRGGSAG